AKPVTTSDIFTAGRRVLVDVLQEASNQKSVADFIEAVRSGDSAQIQRTREAVDNLFKADQRMQGLALRLESMFSRNLTRDREAGEMDAVKQEAVAKKATELRQRFQNYMRETVLFELLYTEGNRILIDGKDVGSLLGIDRMTVTINGKNTELLGGLFNTVDRSPTDLIGRGASHFLIAIGIDMGFDVSAATGIGKTRGQLLGASFFNSNRGLNSGYERGKVALVLEGGPAVAKFFKDATRADPNGISLNALAKGLGLELVDATPFITKGNRDYGGLQQKLLSDNAVLVTDILTKTHVFNNIDQAAGREFLAFLGDNFGRTVLDEAQFAAFSRVKAIIASGSRPEAVTKDRLLQVKNALKEIEAEGFWQHQYKDKNKFIREAGRDEAGKNKDVLGFYVDETASQVVFSDALNTRLTKIAEKYGITLASELSSIFLALYGETTRMSLTVDPVTNKVTMKPADNQQINKDQQSSDVMYQIAFLYKSLKDLSIRQKEGTRIGEELGGDQHATQQLKDLTFSGFKFEQAKDRKGLELTEFNWDVLGEWFDFGGIGKLDTKMGTPVQSNFVRGAVALTATMPEYIRLFTGNRLLELGKSSPDLAFLMGRRLSLSVYKDEESFIAAVKDQTRDVADQMRYDTKGQVLDNLLFIINDPAQRTWIYKALNEILKSDAAEFARARTFLESCFGKDAEGGQVSADKGSLNIDQHASSKKTLDIGDEGAQGRKVIIATERAGTGWDLKRASFDKDTGIIREDEQSTGATRSDLFEYMYSQISQSPTHVFAFDVQNYPAHFLAQVIGRDRSNVGQVRLFADREAMIRT
ncbi:MAG: hypothetical protein WCJ71_10540, partial [Candidatus Omnitrophota bacterium]